MVDSFDRYWPWDIPLHLYAEDFVPKHGRVIVEALSDWLGDFKARHVNSDAAHGRLSSGYDFRRDCVRFSHKVAAVTDAALKTDADVLIWMDADTVTHSAVKKEWLESLFDCSAYIAWLDRVGNYPEAGFYMLNCRHREHGNVMSRFRELYMTDRVFDLNETHDAYVMQRVISDAGVSAHSLSGRKGRRCGHPLVNSRLAECLDHLKGQRKVEGRSRRTDIHVPRTENYWR